MKIDLSNKVAVVTGGTSGIGLSTAAALAKAGAQIAICSSTSQKVNDALDYLKGKNISAYGEVVDVSDSSRIFSFADNVEKEFGGIDIWISNAAISAASKLINTPEDVWQRIMDVNVKSIYFGGRIAADKFKKRGGGVLVNAGSFSSVIPSVGSGAYAASKAAVSSLNRVFAAELAPYNIRVIEYIPGVIRTDMTEKVIKARGPVLKSQIAQQRFGSGEDIANVIVFLVSDYASYVTGVSVEISGGKFCVQNSEVAWERK